MCLVDFITSLHYLLHYIDSVMLHGKPVPQQIQTRRNFFH